MEDNVKYFGILMGCVSLNEAFAPLMSGALQQAMFMKSLPLTNAKRVTLLAVVAARAHTLEHIPIPVALPTVEVLENSLALSAIQGYTVQHELFPVPHPATCTIHSPTMGRL